MKLSAQSHTSIAVAVKKAMERYLSDKGQNFVTDIYLQPIQETGELFIYNDDEEVLSQVVVQEWVDCTPEAYSDSVEANLRFVLETLQKEGFFEQVAIMKPYSLVLIDNEKETIADLLLVDDDTMLVNDGLLQGLGEELDAFLKDLLEK